MAHRFASVAKILTDQLVVELVNENRALKLELFWKNHSITKLQNEMQWANQKEPGGPGCNCLACAVSGRKDEENGIPASGFECIFKPYFEALLQECGLSVEPCCEEYCMHISDDTGNTVYNNDSHFVSIGREDWKAFSYGAKLWKEPHSDQDPELRKLVRLFELLQ